MMKYVPLILLISTLYNVSAVNKYSAAANSQTEPVKSLRTLENPFRMAKLNLLWTKALLRLTDTKLKSLYGELKIHDKEEITWKRLKSEGSDKEGLKEAELRSKLIGIMSTYDLLEHFGDVEDPKKAKRHRHFNDVDEYINKSLFKDKKLNHLWMKVEQAGFTSVELKALREEFSHHQDKIDQYFSLLHHVEKGPEDEHENSLDESLDRFNTLETAEEQPKKDHRVKVEALREKHRDLRDGYDRLHRLAANGPDSKEFIEPKVQGLWRIALETNFTADELESLRVELVHYENRLMKLRHMQVESALVDNGDAEVANDADNNIKRQARKVEKLHLAIESRIMQKHVEL